MIEQVYIDFIVSLITAILTLLGYKGFQLIRNGNYVRQGDLNFVKNDLEYRLESLESMSSKMNAKYMMRDNRAGAADDFAALRDSLPAIIDKLPNIDNASKESLKALLPLIPDNMIKELIKSVNLNGLKLN